MTIVHRHAPDQARLAAVLGLCFLVTISYPALVELPQEMTPGHLLMLACVPVWALACVWHPVAVLDPKSRFASAVILTCCGLLIACAILSAFVADDPFRVARPVISFSTAFAMFALVVGSITVQRLYIFLTTLCLALVVVCILTVAAYYEPGLHDRIFGDADRASGFFKNPNQFGIAIATVLPPAIAMFFASRRKLIWGVALTFLILGMLASGSKTNLLISLMTVLSLLVLFCMISYSGRQRAAMLAIAILGYLLLIMVAILGLGALNPRALRLLQQLFQGDAPDSIGSREEIWAESLDLFMANPVLGIGAGQPIQPHVAHSHNVIMEFARTLGVPGIVLITILVIAIALCCAEVILTALRSRRADPGARYVCIGLAVSPLAYIASNFTSDSFGPTTSPYLYATLFLCLASRSLLLPPR